MENAWTMEWEKLKDEINRLFRNIEQLEKENAELRAERDYWEKLSVRYLSD